MKVKLGLRPKFILVFFAFMIILSGVIAYIIQDRYEQTIIGKYYDHAMSIVKLAASELDGDRIKQYVETMEESEAYEADLARLNNIKKETDVYYLYVMYPYNKWKGIFVFEAALTEEQFSSDGFSAAKLGDEVQFGKDFPTAMEVLETGEPGRQLDITTTLQGDVKERLASAYAPIKDSNGTVVAFVGLDMLMSDIDDSIQEASSEVIVWIIGITLLCFSILMVIVQISILSPVKKLTRAAENLADGNYEEHIQVHGKDEISETTKVFNRMSTSIKGHVEEISLINAAYHKYVPSQFFAFLQKENVTEVELGNQKQKELAILNFNINDFKQQIRPMNSKEMFAFINENLQQVIPEVAQEQGMIDTFHEGGFTALYEKDCESALNTAVNICQKLQRTEKLQFSIGIAYGAVMLGIVGHDSRMSAISISQQTETAQFLQKLAPKYGAHILVTGTAVAQIYDFTELYHARVLGYVFNSFTGQIEKIYDVYDGDAEEIRQQKDLTKALFEEGINLYCARKFYEARNAFIEVLKQFRKDAAAREYLFLCNQYYQMEQNEEIAICIEKF